MIKNSLFFLLLTLFLAGCAENGSMIEVAPVKQIIVENNTSTTTKTEQVNNSDNNPSTEIINIENKEETFFDESTMNTISGALILIIGIMILL